MIGYMRSQEETAFSNPVFLERSINLAALSILRILRSPDFDISVDRAAGEEIYFSAINLFKKATLLSDDLNARGVTILSQL